MYTHKKYQRKNIENTHTYMHTNSHTQGLRQACTLFLAIILLPLATGALVDFTIGVPLRVSYNQTVVFSPIPLWAVGLVTLKFGMRAVLTFPWLSPTARMALQQVFVERQIDHVYFIEMLQIFALTILRPILVVLAVPYVLCFVVLPPLGVTITACYFIWRGFFPALAMLCASTVIVAHVVQSVRDLHDKIRDSLYLVGRKLHNIDQ
jgi:hypothetical protein